MYRKWYKEIKARGLRYVFLSGAKYVAGEVETSPGVDDPFMRKVWHRVRRNFFWISLVQECISCSADTLQRGSDRSRAQRRSYIENGKRYMSYEISRVSRRHRVRASFYTARLFMKIV